MTSLKNLRIAFVLLAVLALGFSLYAADPALKPRRDNLSHRMMCTCGCNELLGECSHAGCQSSTTMLHELDNYLADGKNDKEILAAFTDKYGSTVLAAPEAKGFHLVAWFAPFTLLLLGLVGIIVLIRHTQRKYKLTHAQSGTTEAAAPLDDSILERIRRDTGGEDSK